MLRRRTHIVPTESFTKSVPGTVETQLTKEEVRRVLKPSPGLAPVLDASTPFRPRPVQGQILRMETADNHIRVCYGESRGAYQYQVKGLHVVDGRPLYAARKIGNTWFAVYGALTYRNFREISQLTAVDGRPLYYAINDFNGYVVYGNDPLVRGYRFVQDLHFKDGQIRFYGGHHSHVYRVTIPKP